MLKENILIKTSAVYIINPHECFICHYQITNQKRTLYFLIQILHGEFSEQRVHNEQAWTTTFQSNQTPEESSWTMYFEDFFETSSSIVDVGEFSSSSVSDAMSFVSTKKTLYVSKPERSNSSNKFNTKRTQNREIPFGHHHDLEDTASSPSRCPNVRVALPLSLFL